jgi:predicted negative regulator of RcsB-dependent stress response
VESYRTEEEQVEALKRWWEENGRSTIIAIVVALALAFGWQGWQRHAQQQRDGASDIYQAMLAAAGSGESGEELRVTLSSFAERLKADYPDTVYARFGALQLARAAVNAGELERAEEELRWVIAGADRDSDVARVATLRLARVLAARGAGERALEILDEADPAGYAGAYAMARGDILLLLDRDSEARQAYASARLQGAGAAGPAGPGTLEQKLQSLNPVPAEAVDAEPLTLPPEAVDAAADDAGGAAPVDGDG